jgi:DNA-binding response OmpR family regulator
MSTPEIATEANGGPVVVIADDDTDIRQLIGVAARRAGGVVRASVADGGAALQAIREIRPDLAILDVSMPVLTGLQVCRSVRQDLDLAGTRVLLLSAAVQPAAVAAGITAGADRYALKPFSPRTLAEQIRELLTGAVPAR